MRCFVGIIGLGIFSLIGCSSPGQPFAYKDIKASVALSASPSQPNTAQSVSLAFTLRNTWDKPLTVPWQIKSFVPPASPITSGTIITNGSKYISEEGSASLTHVVGTLTPGSYSYALIIDPDNSIDEHDETNNISQTTLLVANQDISFGTPLPTFTLGSPAATSQIMVQFSLLHTHTTATTAPTAAAINVPITVKLNGTLVTPISVNPVSPVTVDPASTNPVPVSVTLPATNAAGIFPYTIELSPADGDDSNTNNNSTTISVVIPSAG
jgi:CARDB